MSPALRARRPSRRRVPLAALGVLAAVALLASPAAAQGGEPAWWFGAGVGLLSPGEVKDGSTRSTWDFGEAAQLRASAERSLGGNATVGATLGYARAPLTYHYWNVVPNALAGTTSATRTAGDPPCALCDAEADLWSLLATFQAGGGRGFHHVVNVSAGVTRFTRFRTTEGVAFAPGGDTDFTFALGYGFGYGLSERTHLVLVQDLAFLLHQRGELRGGDRSLVRQPITRIGLRVGTGSRQR